MRAPRTAASRPKLCGVVSIINSPSVVFAKIGVSGYGFFFELASPTYFFFFFLGALINGTIGFLDFMSRKC